LTKGIASARRLTLGGTPHDSAASGAAPTTAVLTTVVGEVPLSSELLPPAVPWSAVVEWPAVGSVCSAAAEAVAPVEVVGAAAGSASACARPYLCAAFLLASSARSARSKARTLSAMVCRDCTHSIPTHRRTLASSFACTTTLP
jgi:hypothetical protein